MINESLKYVEANKFHSKFNYDVAQFTPDQHRALLKSLTQLIGKSSRSR